MPFIWLHAFAFAAWITLNVWPGADHPDPYPFIFLTLMVSLEAIFLSTLVLISQNDDARVAERRNALDLQINLLSEQEKHQDAAAAGGHRTQARHPRRR
ncbi:DUF1003 domain-containing protein [Schlegelella sp. S2-27]|uniref:DUF1003 domain-containing protein n=2 Tax=Caldimonas mangrovi TaxID=2944811 RepID=A0ABT0YLD9_9BURK|nr:DUF1003 domain-containing protein [Caldimonas mangrovi]MCM5679552.1 DUF1003 domain-containing protein [Caldimonas mangrovi]